MLKYLKYILPVIIVFLSLTVSAQENNRIWKGNKEYRDRNYEQATAEYQKSLELSPSAKASYNMANALYRQKKYKEAGSIYQSIASSAEDKMEKAEAYHNLGNAMLKSKEIDKGIEAYKAALRNNPSDEATRYNLSYAMKLKQQEEEQKKDDQNKDDQNKDQEQNKDQQNQDQQKKDEQDKKDQQNQDQKDQQQKEQEQEQQQQQPQPNEVSKEDAARMLENLENDEQKTQQKIQMQQRKSSKVKIENDW